MKQLIIIGEGQTEQTFCKDVLFNHFFEHKILVQNPTIKKTMGGIVSWHILKREIEIHLKSSPKATVTTLIDFYGLKEDHNFPLWNESKRETKVNDRVSLLENAMQNEIDDSIRHRFIPYIQVYEFEALLFSNATIFETEFERSEILDYEFLQQTLLIAPEEINDGLETAPSKRLEKIIKGYNKVLYGSLLSSEIGLDTIREKCPRFNQWIGSLEKI